MPPSDNPKKTATITIILVSMLFVQSLAIYGCSPVNRAQNESIPQPNVMLVRSDSHAVQLVLDYIGQEGSALYNIEAIKVDEDSKS